jgi:TMEM175 potassium channel family protein
MSRGRLEAFSDGVIAVVITIMVLTLHPPAGSSLHDLRPLVPKVAVYLLSFVFVAIYWTNHHHLMQVVDRVSGSVLWANAHLLFWLSLTPAAAAWLGPHIADSAPVAIYGVVLFGSAIAYGVLVRCLIGADAPDSRIARAVGRDEKGLLSAVAYAAAIAVSPWVPWLSIGLYIAVALAWLVPDRRMERVMATVPETD